VLYAAGSTAVECHARPAWTETYLRIYRVALQLGDPARTPRSPDCKAKPGGASPPLTSCAGLPSPPYPAEPSDRPGQEVV
jgi:hypothetical protein